MASHYGHAHRKARAELLADDPLCVHCMTNVAEVADHQPPIALHEHQPGTGCCSYVPSCKACSYQQAGEVSSLGANGRAAAGLGLEVLFEEPDPSPGRDDPIWRVPWLVELVDSMPETATWPRWMNPPHPDAIGSYGAEFVQFANDRQGIELRWWQQLISVRLLEHDEDGRLVWERVLTTVARQLGKTHWIRELLLWAVQDPRRFWQADALVLCSRKLLTAERAAEPMVLWAADRDGWSRARSQGQQRVSVDKPDGTRNDILIRSLDAIYGETIGMGVIDETWDADPSVVREGLEYTTLASEGMLVYTSTAHRRATSVALNMRSEAFGSMTDPEADNYVLLIEWAADRDLEEDDVTGWRQASPHWTAHRERFIKRSLNAARNGETMDPDEPDPMEAFRAQVLNQWPIRRTKRGPGEPLFETGQWAGALLSHEPPVDDLVMTINDNYGKGLAVVVAGLSETDRVAVEGECFDDEEAAWAYAASYVDDVHQILVGADLVHRPETHQLGPVTTRGSQDVKSGLSVLRSLMDVDQLTHVGTPSFADQVLECRLRQSPTGLVIASKGRHDVIKAMAWGVAEVQRQRAIIGTVM